MLKSLKLYPRETSPRTESSHVTAKSQRVDSAVEAFRGSGPIEEQSAARLAGSVAEYDVAGARSLI
jgi:hypothetical protein